MTALRLTIAFALAGCGGRIEAEQPDAEPAEPCWIFNPNAPGNAGTIVHTETDAPAPPSCARMGIQDRQDAIAFCCPSEPVR